MPRNESIKKAMVIGSGPIVIGQAAEFDYAGAQACRVLKAEGIETVLVNSNPATIMTDKRLADAIYLEPLTLESVKRIIEKERPDSLLAGLGGQTGLTLGMQLHKDGFLKRMGVRLIGVNAEAIDKAEDRELFKETMEKLGQPMIPSGIAQSTEEALKIAEEIEYPVIVRPAFTLGGAGGGVAYDKDELARIAENGLSLSPITQILVEKYIYGWKEIEFEVMRDGAGTAIAVCSMENFDPVGVHTGDSIVAAPALTLAHKEYEMLRRAALDIVAALGVEGGCNCQFALDPKSFRYAVIEVNPRVSRSSALASKATGYPIAKVSTKVALGYTLDEIQNEITGKTYACFEPAIDYVVVKLPKWPFDKFVNASRTLGTQMKATGEVMAIAPSFEAALMKAVRGAEIGLDTLNAGVSAPDGDWDALLARCDDLRLFTMFAAIKAGMPLAHIHEITKIDPFFLAKLERLAAFEAAISGDLNEENYLLGKTLGYTDAALMRISSSPLPCPHRFASYKMVDTCAAEFAAQTPYFYASYDEECEARTHTKAADKPRILVLGSGPIRIGQGIEFDYSSVHCVDALKRLGYEVIIANNNPETVSTDFDTADRLYFEPLTKEDVMDVIEVEKPEGVVVAFGGQTAVKLAGFLDQAGIRILGTSAEGIDLAEDRERFDALLQRLGIRRPKGAAVHTKEEAVQAAKSLGYPVLVRPSYVIGGQNMCIAYAQADIESYMDMILAGGIENPVLIDQYLMGTELEVDAISDGTEVLIPGIMQHIERAGVHSGDSIAVYPPYSINDRMRATILRYSEQLALAMGTEGLVNIQYLIHEELLYVIEVNPRASRTIPYISKVTGVPMVDVATRVMLGEKLCELGYGTGLYPAPPYVAVKVPVFSFEKLTDASSALGPEMKSTGEVLGLGKNLNEALFKGLTSAGFLLPAGESGEDGKKGVYISVNDRDRLDILPLTKKFFDLGFRLYATRGTAEAIRALEIEVETVGKLCESEEVLSLLNAGKLHYILMTGTGRKDEVEDYIRLHRHALQKSVVCLTSLDTANALADILESRYTQRNTELVNINDLRACREKLPFAKMQGSGNDYIFVENFDGRIRCPESLAISFSDRCLGIGGSGLVLMEKSRVADAKMRVFNRDGSEAMMAGNSIRCVGKYLYDKQLVRKEVMHVETSSGIKTLRLYLTDGKVSSVRVEMGQVSFAPAAVPVQMDCEEALDQPFTLDGKEYRVSCANVGNPHCVVFCDKVDDIDLSTLGPRFENDPRFPARVNTGFARVVHPCMLKLRVFERGNGETLACGTGACAAVAAAVRLGLCLPDKDIVVKMRGGDLLVHYKDGNVFLAGEAALVYEGVIEY